MNRAYGTLYEEEAFFLNGLKPVATRCFEPTALLNKQLLINREKHLSDNFPVHTNNFITTYNAGIYIGTVIFYNLANVMT
jgi:hypothetical protein